MKRERDWALKMIKIRDTIDKEEWESRDEIQKNGNIKRPRKRARNEGEKRRTVLKISYLDVFKVSEKGNVGIVVLPLPQGLSLEVN